MQKQGFTIIELVIVISVLVILIGIAIPRMKGMQDAAYIAKVKHELATLQSAVESYYAFSTPHTYPNSSAGYMAQPALINASPQIISTYLYDPFCSSSVNSCSGHYQEYGYIGPDNIGGAQYYVIWSVGPAAQPSSMCGLYSDGSVALYNGPSGPPTLCTAGSPGCPICVTNGKGC
ncbi:MAG: type II secretion system protein [Candidatus Omnitrophica bacterium]|nr:type II secretion system protein [Candidatus Omnitrophota bacterium]